jgi:hypothetical protein
VRIVLDESPIDQPDGYYVTIAPHDTHTLSFTEEDHFGWGRDLKQDIYLRLWLIGRRSPIWIGSLDRVGIGAGGLRGERTNS